MNIVIKAGGPKLESYACRTFTASARHWSDFPCTRLPRLTAYSRRLSVTRHYSFGLSRTGLEEDAVQVPQDTPRRTKRPAAAKNSLRQVVVEAQRSKDDAGVKQRWTKEKRTLKRVRAFCVAQEYDCVKIAGILKSLGYQIDPYGTALYPQVVHVTVTRGLKEGQDESTLGDLFVFPSGTVVAWDIPKDFVTDLISKKFQRAAQVPLIALEEEALEYSEDATREHCSIRADRIIIGTKINLSSQDTEPLLDKAETADTRNLHNHKRDIVLAKVAFSSGLSRSTKLAALESLLSDYFESTKSIPAVMSSGGYIPFTRSFIFQKTGQLLGIRAQLNLYSELTDSLPDLFWDSKHELGLESYYEQVGKSLDTNVRIKVLNEKMDYAGDIASVLRQQLSEKHGVRLEWIIIALIFVEVVIEVRKEFVVDSTPKESNRT